MKVVLFLFAIFAVCSVALSALAVYGPPPPGKPGYCWADITGPMESGEVKQVKNQCATASCGGGKTIQIATCGVATVNGVRLTHVDLSKPYPKCCPGNH